MNSPVDCGIPCQFMALALLSDKNKILTPYKKSNKPYVSIEELDIRPRQLVPSVRKTQQNSALNFAAQLAKKAAETGVKYAVDSFGQMVKNRKQKGSLNKAIARVNNENNSGVIPHVSGAPVAVGTRVNYSRPKFANSKGVMTISHREVISSLDMAVNAIAYNRLVNPTNAYLFPWLATIAGNYDKYRFSSLAFEYVPNCSTATPGSVTLAWDPAGSDENKSFMELFSMHSVNVSAWMPGVLSIPGCPEKYMGEQSPSTYSGSDMYNHGNLVIGTNGAALSDVGMLFVTYTVQLSYPQPATGCNSVISYAAAGSGVVLSTYNNLAGFEYDGTIPAGTWKATFLIKGTDLSNLAITTGAGISYQNAEPVGVAAASTRVLYSVFLKSFGTATSYIRFTPTYTTLTLAQLRIEKISSYEYASTAIDV